MRGLIVAAFRGDSKRMFYRLKKDATGLGRLTRFAAVLTLFALAGSSAGYAQEACVVCDGPGAIYRCSVEKSDKLARFGSVADKAVQHVCAKEMARQGKHEKCSARRDASPANCDGALRMITLASLLEAESAPQPAAPPPPATPPKSAAPPAVAAPAKTAASVPAKVEPEKPAPAVTQPPRTVQEMAERTSKDPGGSIGDTAQRTWKCLTTLFQKC
jgi:hypothetical protein